jgi:hypothetical protein
VRPFELVILQALDAAFSKGGYGRSDGDDTPEVSTQALMPMLF